jgi:hypothetical protein
MFSSNYLIKNGVELEEVSRPTEAVYQLPPEMFLQDTYSLLEVVLL